MFFVSCVLPPYILRSFILYQYAHSIPKKRKKGKKFCFLFSPPEVDYVME